MSEFVFLLRRPSTAETQRFLDGCRNLVLSYGPIGSVRQGSGVGRFDEQVIAIGHGEADFERARVALSTWRHFDIGWVALVPRPASFAVGTDVAVLIRHFGFWSLNGARVVYHILQARFRRDSAAAMSRAIRI